MCCSVGQSSPATGLESASIVLNKGVMYSPAATTIIDTTVRCVSACMREGRGMRACVGAFTNEASLPFSLNSDPLKCD